MQLYCLLFRKRIYGSHYIPEHTTGRNCLRVPAEKKYTAEKKLPAFTKKIKRNVRITGKATPHSFAG